MKAKQGYRKLKRRSPGIGRWLKRYWEKRTCRRWIFKDEALSDISALAIGYDGFESPEDLRSLIDDMANVANKALKQEPWTTRGGG